MGYFGNFFGPMGTQDGGGGGGGTLDLTTPVVGETFPEGSLGALLLKLNVGEAEQPVRVIPSPSGDPEICMAYWNFKFPNSSLASSVVVHFDRVVPTTTAGGWIIVGKRVSATGGSAALIKGQYLITCAEAKWTKIAATLSEDLFDLASLV